MMCLEKENEIYILNNLYLKELEIMKKNKENLLRSLQKGEKKLYKLFNQKI